MICEWDSLLLILPQWMRADVDKLGKKTLTELRLRVNAPPELRLLDARLLLNRKIQASDLIFIINAATRYSPWIAETASKGYITAPGGHRIGICGKANTSSAYMLSASGIGSLCIRIARDFPGLAETAPNTGSVLIIGSPGTGKTTLLRDLIRQRSRKSGQAIAVVDEREELFPRVNGAFCFPSCEYIDVLSGCNKERGIENVLRTMGPDVIAIDEITAAQECETLLNACWCGVSLLATAHAGSKKEFLQRKIYKPIVECGIFERLIILRKDMSWYMEEIGA